MGFSCLPPGIFRGTSNHCTQSLGYLKFFLISSESSAGFGNTMSSAHHLQSEAWRINQTQEHCEWMSLPVCHLHTHQGNPRQSFPFTAPPIAVFADFEERNIVSGVQHCLEFASARLLQVAGSPPLGVCTTFEVLMLPSHSDRGRHLVAWLKDFFVLFFYSTLRCCPNSSLAMASAVLVAVRSKASFSFQCFL